MHQLFEARQVDCVGRAGGIHEAAELQVYADEVSADLFHLAEVPFDGWPFGGPILFEQAVLIVAVLVEAPGREGRARRSQDEAGAIFADCHFFQGSGGVGGAQTGQHTGEGSSGHIRAYDGR